MKTLLLLSLLFTNFALAQDLILGTPAAAGSACLPGQVDISILNNQILLRPKGLSVKNGRVVCTLAVPASVPAGKRLVIEEVSLLGQHQLPKKSTAKISAEAFLAGGRGKVLALSLGSKKTVSQGEIRLSGQNTAVSGCGRESIVRLNASIIASGKGQTSVSDIALKLKLEDCL